MVKLILRCDPPLKPPIGSPFLDVPPEVRREIFRLVFQDDVIRVTCADPLHCLQLGNHASRSYVKHRDLGITEVSKQMRGESLPMLLAHAVFDVYRFHRSRSIDHQGLPAERERHFKEVVARMQRICGREHLLRNVNGKKQPLALDSMWTNFRRPIPAVKEMTIALTVDYRNKPYVQIIRKLIQVPKSIRLVLEMEIIGIIDPGTLSFVARYRAVEGIVTKYNLPRNPRVKELCWKCVADLGVRWDENAKAFGFLEVLSTSKFSRRAFL